MKKLTSKSSNIISNAKVSDPFIFSFVKTEKIGYYFSDEKGNLLSIQNSHKQDS